MDPRMDPRRKDYNPKLAADLAKRGPSRSPEGQGAPKIMKPTPREEGAAPTDPRRSSLADGPHAMQPRPSNTTRRPSNQLTEARVDGGVSVNSPASLGSNRSQYEDAQSGRSTPVNASNAVAGQSVPPAPEMSVNGAVGGVSASSPVVDILMSFTSQVANIATLQHSKAHADKELKKAEDEYQHMSKHFAGFPTLKDQKGLVKSAAEKRVKLLQDKFDEQMAVQKLLAQNIAALIAKPAAIASTETTPSGAQEIDKLRAKVAELEDTIKENRGAINNKCDTQVEEASKRKALIKANTTSLESLKKTVDAQEKAHSDIKKMDTDIKRMAGEIKALTKTKDKHTKDLKDLSAFAMGDEKEDLKGPLNEDSSLAKKVQHFKIAVDGIKKDITALRESVQEDGKESAVKHLKNLDRLVNDLATEIRGDGKPPLMQRLSQLEQDYTAVEAEVKGVKDGAKSLQTPAPPARQPTRDLAAIEERVHGLGESWNDFQEVFNVKQDEKEKALIDKIWDLVEQSEGRMKEEVLQIRDGRVDDQIKIDDAFEQLSTKINELKQSAEGFAAGMNDIEATKNAHRDFVTQLQDLSTKLEQKVDKGQHLALQAQVDGLKSAGQSRTPTPGPGQTVPQRMTNGVAGSPAINGFHPQTNGSPKINGAPQVMGPPPSNNIQELIKKVDYLTAKHDSLTMVFQNLQAQYNNIVTDELAAEMMNQMGEVWPHAADFNASIDEMHGRLAAVEGGVANANTLGSDVQALKQRVTGLEGKTEALEETFK